MNAHSLILIFSGGVVNKSFKQIPLEGCFRRPHFSIYNNT